MLSRRVLLAATASLPVLVAGTPALAASPAYGAPARPPISPRAEWAGSLAPRGPLVEESDVRFLLVHHTQTPNTDTTPERVVARLRSVFAYHTGSERNWADVAYNFFVDPSGTIWEARQGSLNRPMRGDATGGSQGFALLCCFVGDFTAQPPTSAALSAMTALLAWLAAREGLDLNAQVTFTSRGSSKWAKGRQVTTDAVAGHRDMSLTECPGDALYPLVRSRLLPGARALLAAASTTPTPAPAPTGTPTPEPSGTAEPTASATPKVTASDTPQPTASEEPVSPGASTTGLPPDAGGWLIGAGVTAGAVAVASVVAVRRARRSAADEPDGEHDAADGQHGEEPDQEPPQGG